MKAPRGVTLVEVLASVVIVGISFVVLAQGLVSASQASSTSQSYSRATMVGLRKMAEVEAGVYPLTMGVDETVEDDRHTFDVSIQPTPTERAGLVEVVVEVKWMMRGREHSTRLTRYIAESLRKTE